MVTRMILSRYCDDPPEEASSREISGGPLYPDIVDIIDKCTVVAWTKKCIRDVREMSFDEQQISLWITRAVKTGRFKGSMWCEGNKEGVWAACDSYVVTDCQWNENAGKELSCDYYIKFFLNKGGTVVMTVSFHLSN